MPRSFPLTITVLALALFLIDACLAAKNYRYNRLVREYECAYPEQSMCQADFDGDGRPTVIQIIPHADAYVELPPKFPEGSQGLLRLNVRDIDNTDKTHVAVRTEMGKARLLIYDGSVRVVYAWDGEKLAEYPQTAIDKEILSAMAAVDVTGTFEQWLIYLLLMWPLRIGYILLFVVAVVSYRRRRRAEGSVA